MTDPDPRTDLAGYLGLTEEQARICRQSAEDGYTGIRGKVGARLIEQDQARADEPDDGQHAMLDIDALGGPKMLRETMCVAQGAVLREGHAGAQLHADRIASIIDVCDQHRPLGPDGKHGTRQCTLTCGCIDKRDPEPDDGLIPVTVRLTAEEVRARQSHDPRAYGSNIDVTKLNAACRAIDLPAPKPPWKSPLDNLPDLTESQCWDAVRIAGEGPDSPVMWAQVGRALIAAGWTPEEEA